MIVLSCFIVLMVITGSHSTCAPLCECTKGSVVQCFNLTRIPEFLPLHTTVLDLRGCNLGVLKADSFWMLPHLHTLVMSDCEVEHIERKTFRGLRQLRNLYLDNNKLSLVDNELFKDLTRLRLLSLRANQIKSIQPQAFHHQHFLRVLNLHDNYLTHLEASVFDHCLHLKHLHLKNNPFACNCELVALAKYLKSFSAKGIEDTQATCASPASHNTASVSAIPLHLFACTMPTIMHNPQSAQVNMGSSASFLCEVDGDPYPQIIWMHNGTVLNPSSDHKYKFHNGNGSLTIQSTSEPDQGYYECIAENAAGSVRTRRAQLSYPDSTQPYFTVSPRDLGAREGSRVELFCRAEGTPKPTILWYRRDRQVTWSPRIQLEQENTVLVITQLLHTDAGKYTCTAINAAGQTETSATIRVIANEPPRIVTAPGDKTVQEGTTAQFICTAQGDPEPTIQWLFNGSPIQRGDHYHVSLDTTTLRINSVTMKDMGHYWCQANNEVGSMSTDVQLTVLGAGGVAATRPSPPRQPLTRPPNRSFNQRPASTRRPPVFRPAPQPVTPLQDLDVERLAARLPPIERSRSREVSRVVPSTSNYADLVNEDEVSSIIRNSVAEATMNVDRAINATRTRIYSSSSKSPSELLELFRFPGPQAIELARAREIYEEAVFIIQQELRRGLYVNTTSENIGDVHYESVLSVSHMQMLMELTGCVPGQFVDSCADICYHTKYRSYDGQCNNFNRPMLGVSLMPFGRNLEPIYENGFNTPVGWERDRLYNGFKKPNARLVSMKVIATATVTSDEEYSSMFMQWGQFIDHDLTLAAAATSRHVFRSGAICNSTCERFAPCFNIDMPPEDPRRRSNMALPCIEFERSSAVCGSGQTSVIFKRVSKREQLNMVTSFIDGSMIYGSNEQNALDLRDLYGDHGLMRFDIVSQAQKPYLPFNRDAPMDCRRKVNVTHPIRCFLAGDFRANEQLGLTAMHTIWLREHNRIASKLLTINPHWDGEKIYQETRKLIGGMLQHINQVHWLPKVLGPEGMSRIPTYSGYNSSVDVTAANAFGAAAFRFGHGLINPTLFRLDNNYEPIREGHLPLHEAFFAPERLLSEGGIDPILRGLLATAMKAPRPDQLLNKELTERLFYKAHHVALDLAALNIQRGRDHALPGYLSWRRWCGLSASESWSSLRRDIPDSRVLSQLETIYGHPDNMDLWVGGMVERLLPGGRVGPTFACIIADQFRRTRDGDRFWYEQEGVFTKLQQMEIERSCLSKVLCENGDNIDRITKDVFLHAKNLSNELMSCADIPSINLNMWQECCQSSCSAASPSHSEMLHGVSGQGDTAQDQVFEMRNQIHDLESKLQQLHSVIDRMQHKMESGSEPSTTSTNGCNVDGHIKEDGATWSIDRCTQCTCKKRAIWCQADEQCQP